MSLGKLGNHINIITAEPKRDADGFAVLADTVIASVHAYREDRHGSEKWANMAAFSTATSLFRFRNIPGVTVTTAMVIVCDGERYNIVNVDIMRGRGMYVDCYTEKITPSVR